MIMQRTLLILLGAVLSTGLAIGQEVKSPPKKDDRLKVMSFNIRNGKANGMEPTTGTNANELVVKAIEDYAHPIYLALRRLLNSKPTFYSKHLPRIFPRWTGT